MRNYDTITRESGFNYEGSKRLGEYDNVGDQWKRYHWCKTQLLGYADDTSTYYIVPDVTGSTKLIMNSSSVVNRLDYDHLGYLRNKTTDPQVELLWGGFICIDISGNYILCDSTKYYVPILGVGFNILNKLDLIIQKTVNYCLKNKIGFNFSDRIGNVSYLLLFGLLGSGHECWWEYRSNSGKIERRYCCRWREGWIGRWGEAHCQTTWREVGEDSFLYFDLSDFHIWADQDVEIFELH